MIRLGKIKDLEDIVALTAEFFSPFLRNHGVEVIDDDVRNVALQAIVNNRILVVERDDKVVGIASWMVIPHPANSKMKIFYETIWCVKSNHKTDALSLLRTLEGEAELVGADLMLMANLAEENEAQLKRIFIKRGFSFLETHYGKQLQGA